jgi:hypothetical protein
MSLQNLNTFYSRNTSMVCAILHLGLCDSNVSTYISVNLEYCSTGVMFIDLLIPSEKSINTVLVF